MLVRLDTSQGWTIPNSTTQYADTVGEIQFPDEFAMKGGYVCVWWPKIGVVNYWSPQFLIEIKQQ